MASTGNPKQIEIWTVYRDPIDFPGKFVVRKFLCNTPTDEHYTSKTIEGVREHIPAGLVKLMRQRDDDPKIVEVWL